MSEKIEREVVFVGQNREFKSIQDALFFKGNENLEIRLDNEIYSELVELISSKNIKIIGDEKTIIKNSILIINSENVSLSNLMLLLSYLQS